MISHLRKRIGAPLAVLFVLALLAAACSGDSDTAEAPEAGDAAEPEPEAPEPEAEPEPEAPEPETEPEPEAPEPETEPAAPLVIAVSTEPSTLDAQAVNDRSSRVVTANIFETLLTRTADGVLVPGLAESFEAVDDDTWRFSLRSGITFHDGSAFNAESAAFSLNRMLDEEYETQRSSYIRGILDAVAVDEFTLDINTDGINAVLPLEVAQLPMIPLDTGDEINDAPVGTGPYVFSSWDRGESITAVANPDYWGDAPNIAEFQVRFIADSQTALNALQAGEVDLVLDILPEQVDLVPVAKSAPATEFSFVQFNTYKPELSDPRVRIALNMAVDKELLAEGLYGGYARPNAAQHLSETMLGYNDDLEAFPYDPDRARELLAEAGYADGFEITLNAPIGRYLRAEESAEYIAQAFNDVGVDTTVRLWEWNEFRSAGRIPGDEPEAFDLRYAWNSNEWFDAARITSHVTCGGSSSKICDERVTELFEQGVATLDQDMRDAIYQEAWAGLNANPHAVYLLQQDLIYGLSERLNWDPRLDDEYLVASMSLSG